MARDALIGKQRVVNLLVVPRENFSAKYNSSKETKDALLKVIKSADFNLKINRIMSVCSNGVRIEALSMDLDKLMNSKELETAGLKIEPESRANPKLFIHGVLYGLSRDEIKSEIIALNLKEHNPISRWYMFFHRRTGKKR